MRMFEAFGPATTGASLYTHAEDILIRVKNRAIARHTKQSG
jgi:hypothetical protein